MSRELGIWRRLDHPNIVLFLGTARGEDFGSDHPCMVSMWMPHGTLIEYVKQRGSMLSVPNRIQLVSTEHFVTLTQFTTGRSMSQIQGSAAGLEYRMITDSSCCGFYMTSSCSTFEWPCPWGFPSRGLYHLIVTSIRLIYYLCRAIF